MLILLDLSAAFDTVDHELLIDDNVGYIGEEGVALNWFKSYLENRSYHVIINGTKSERTLQRGVPQECVLGPVLFSIYTIELAWILKQQCKVQNVCRYAILLHNK